MPYFSDQMTLAEYKAFSSSKGLQGLGAPPAPPPPDLSTPTAQCRSAATALLNGTGSNKLPANCYDLLARRPRGVTCRSILQRIADGRKARMPGADDSCAIPTKDTVPSSELPGAKSPGRDSDAGAPHGGTQGQPGPDDTSWPSSDAGGSSSSSSIPTWAKVVGGVLGAGILGYGLLYGVGKMRNARAARG